MLNPNMAMILISTQSVTVKWLIFNLNFVQPADRSACSTFYLPPAGFLFYRRLVGLSSTGSSFSTYNRSSSETPTAMSLATFTSPLTMSSALQGTQLHFSIWACREHNSTFLYAVHSCCLLTSTFFPIIVPFFVQSSSHSVSCFVHTVYAYSVVIINI